MDLPELELAAGERVLLTAASGAGKSTLLQVIAGVLDPVEGTVEVAGTDLHRFKGAKRDRFRGRRIGMVFQTFHLLPGFTTAENIALALAFGVGETGAAAQRARVDELCGRLGIEAHRDRPIEELSVGQQQRVAVARALACRPALVLADEPTASLDPAAADAATALLLEACAADGAALLCVSHDPSMRARFEAAGGRCAALVLGGEVAGTAGGSAAGVAS